MKVGDIVRITQDNIEYNFLKKYSTVVLVVVKEHQVGGYDIAVSVPDFEYGHGADRYERNDCWWTSSEGIEVIEEA